ncbi:MAG: TetR/AcrR family transcriptional regulator [Caulobacteraceae bacterium]
MRYAETHKQETRRRVLSAAAAAVRVHGPDGFSVAEIMAEAGLTHGGFYAHFASKEVLVAAAIEEAFEDVRRRYGGGGPGEGGPQALSAYIDAYLSPQHRDGRGRGCPIAALASDMPRQGPLVRAVYDRGAAGLLARMEGWMPHVEAQDRPGLAASILAEMVGTLTLARALDDPERADLVLADSRRRLRARAGLEPLTGASPTP